MKDPRFIILKGISLAKFLLLSPKCTVNKEQLQSVYMGSKFRNLEIQQNLENKYNVTLKVMPKSESDQLNSNEVQDNPANQLISQIELNAEDIVILQKFVDVAINELMNF